MKSRNLTLTSLAVLTLGGGSLLSGCGGGGDSPTPLQVLAPTSAGVVVNSYIFGATVTLDANDDGAVDITDPIFTLSFLFTGGAVIPPPRSPGGLDLTADGPGC